MWSMLAGGAGQHYWDPFSALVQPEESYESNQKSGDNKERCGKIVGLFRPRMVTPVEHDGPDPGVDASVRGQQVPREQGH